MSVTPPPHDPSPSPKRKASGVLLALAVAVIVFGLGNLLVTSFNHPVDLPPAPAMAGHPGATSPSLNVAAKVDASAGEPSGHDAATEKLIEADAGPKGESARADGGNAVATDKGDRDEKAEKREKAEGEEQDDDSATRRAGGVGDCSVAEKDIAREAWRRNIPTICLTGSGKTQKASLYLPLKGNVGDATYDYRLKSRLVRIMAPNAGSLLTMVQYKLRRHGFRDLKLASEGNAVKFRLTLEKGAAEPTVELKETFIKVVLPLPTSEGE